MARLMEDLEDKEDFEEYERRQKTEEAAKRLEERKFSRMNDSYNEYRDDDDDIDEDHDGDDDDYERMEGDGYASDPELMNAKRNYKFGN